MTKPKRHHKLPTLGDDRWAAWGQIVLDYLTEPRHADVMSTWPVQGMTAMALRQTLGYLENERKAGTYVVKDDAGRDHHFWCSYEVLRGIRTGRIRPPAPVLHPTRPKVHSPHPARAKRAATPA